MAPLHVNIMVLFSTTASLLDKCNSTRNKFRAAKHSLYPLLARKNDNSIKNKLLLYTSFLRPFLTYGFQIWAYATKCHIKLLIQSQNSTIRLLFDVPYYVRNFHLYKEIKYPKLNTFIQVLKINFYPSLENSENRALNSLPS